MRLARWCAAVLVAVTALAACGAEHTFDHGRVVDKEHEDAWMQCLTTSDGKTVNPCGTQLWHPDEWRLLIENCEVPGKPGCHREWFDVDAWEYHEVSIGEQWPEEHRP